MNVAFYAPLKPPGHRVPSGDRAMARMLMAALRYAGHRVELASTLRSHERRGDARAQARIERRGERIAARLLQRYRQRAAAARPQLWFTYHLYHKAPDWVGPVVSDRLGIPYVVAEASHAPKQASGPWAAGLAAAARAMARAACIISLNPNDEACLRALLGGSDRIRRLAPFIDAAASAARARAAGPGAALRAALDLDADGPVLVTVAMMREGAKLASYRLLAEALGRLGDRPWQLLVLGDGPARAQVQAALAGLGQGRVRYAGAVAPAALPAHLAACDVHVWPAIGEAWGMVFLEAAAAGLPSVAGASPGVAAVVAHERTGLLAGAGDAAAFALAVARLLGDPTARRAMGGAARCRALTKHDLRCAAPRLDAVLRDVVARGAAACAHSC